MVQHLNSIALGGITAIRSHLGALQQFDRTLTHNGNSIAQFRFDRADRHNYSMGRS
ncbi:hypothetical protein [Microcoleus sp. D3_18a_C4]|uniref:hypothetical protein n=1 Tax=Microcoleus sp. D3_18a_C4 TaxID=3055332 RepID=UPI002FD506C2